MSESKKLLELTKKLKTKNNTQMVESRKKTLTSLADECEKIISDMFEDDELEIEMFQDVLGLLKMKRSSKVKLNFLKRLSRMKLDAVKYAMNKILFGNVDLKSNKGSANMYFLKIIDNHQKTGSFQFGTNFDNQSKTFDKSSKNDDNESIDVKRGTVWYE